MTRLLVSVRDAAEAQDACDAGVDLIDLKEPAAGPLGPVPPSSWSDIRARVAGRTPLSAALGELTDPQLADRLPHLHGFDFAKIGLAGLAESPDWPRQLEVVWRRFPDGTRRVAVVYADFARCAAPLPEQIVDAAPPSCAALLIDTATKRSGESLFSHLPRERLRGLVDAARARRWVVVLAGSLRLEHLDAALELAPDFVAVRGAVCRGPRDGRLSPQRVQDWVNALRVPSSNDVASIGGTSPATLSTSSPHRSSQACPNS